MARLPNRRGSQVDQEFIDALSDMDAAAVVAAMRDVRETGLAGAAGIRGTRSRRHSGGGAHSHVKA